MAEISPTLVNYIKWMYNRCSKDVQDVFWMSYERSIYVLCPAGGGARKLKNQCKKSITFRWVEWLLVSKCNIVSWLFQRFIFLADSLEQSWSLLRRNCICVSIRLFKSRDWKLVDKMRHSFNFNTEWEIKGSWINKKQVSYYV